MLFIINISKLVLLIFICLNSAPLWAKTKIIRKVQEVNFSEMNIKGTVRNPDGAFLVQKKNMKFMPLYELQKDMDARIRESSLYVKGKE